VNEAQTDYIRRVLSTHPLSTLISTTVLESLAPGNSQQQDAASEAVTALQSGEQITPSQQLQLESKENFPKVQARIV
jgi:hypothetical protein